MKLGHQAPKGCRCNYFNSISLDGNFAYCESHNFIYNPEEEKKKLYNGSPCYYTDSRFIDSNNNFYKSTYLYNKRYKEISLKSCIRRVNKCKNIPTGTIVSFNTGSYLIKNPKLDLSYKFKVKKYNPLGNNYNCRISKLSYFKRFSNCEFSNDLTCKLRENGFIVSVQQNQSFLLNMINTVGGDANSIIDGEIAIAYGYGKKIGFSSFNNDFMGYSNGVDNILWDRFGNFDKWSRCEEIPKNTSIEEIINILKL